VFGYVGKASGVKFFARRFIGVQGRESHIFRNVAPQQPKIGRIGQRSGHARWPIRPARGRHVWIEVNPHSRTCYYYYYALCIMHGEGSSATGRQAGVAESDDAVRDTTSSVCCSVIGHLSTNHVTR